MNSSTSASDDDHKAWRRWLTVFTAVAAALSGTLYVAVVVIDPYSTGRMTPIARIDFLGNRLYADAARVRDPRFDAAVVGNSHVVRLEPARLDLATGRHFVTLAIEGTEPNEHMFLMRMFDRHHGAQALYIVGLDDLSCRAERPAQQHGFVLPRWLYDGSTPRYLSQILSPYAVRMGLRRAEVMLGLASGERPDGYDPKPLIQFNSEQYRRDMITRSQRTEDAPVDAPFPFLDDLAQTLGRIDPGGKVLLLFTPDYRTFLPAPGSEAAARLAACKARASAIARARPGTDVLDLMIEGDKNDDPNNFTDGTHYKDTITRDIETAAAARIKALLAVR